MKHWETTEGSSSIHLFPFENEQQTGLTSVSETAIDRYLKHPIFENSVNHRVKRQKRMQDFQDGNTSFHEDCVAKDMKDNILYKSLEYVDEPILDHAHVNDCGQIHNGLGNSERRIWPYDPNIKEEELVRILIQSLKDMGYYRAAKVLEEESEYILESSMVTQFRRGVLQGDWTTVSKNF
jgi:hypothetical protein